MKKAGYLLLAALLSLTMLAGCQKASGETKEESTEGRTEKEEAEKEEAKDLLSGKHHVEIQVKDYGTIKVELDADAAPVTVTNFVDLAKEGFYDGLTFHRIMSGFMIQGGDPRGDGTGGSDKTIKGEFATNGVENNLSHTRGAISMARSRANDSASSQFFIVHEDSKHLDGSYAAFGYVTEGMEVVDQICEDARPTDDNGTIPSEEQPVIETVKVID
nr:peptidylprolyl isomerase [uncultured Faecalimonas sp.]